MGEVYCLVFPYLLNNIQQHNMLMLILYKYFQLHKVTQHNLEMGNMCYVGEVVCSSMQRMENIFILHGKFMTMQNEY